MDRDDRQEIGRRIAAARVFAGLSQGELGRCLADNPTYGEALSQSGVSRLERGTLEVKARDWGPLLAAVADICGVPDSWYFADFSRLDEIAAEAAKSSFARAIREAARPRSGTPVGAGAPTPVQGAQERKN